MFVGRLLNPNREISALPVEIDHECPLLCGTVDVLQRDLAQFIKLGLRSGHHAVELCCETRHGAQSAMILFDLLLEPTNLVFKVASLGRSLCDPVLGSAQVNLCLLTACGGFGELTLPVLKIPLESSQTRVNLCARLLFVLQATLLRGERGPIGLEICFLSSQ